ncbi:MAG: CPBP family intramembrane metalloprotease, partial [Myxococcales bacterium]|nr:CPBP family intramembrane metalloprotease [Myxococcales bacterium]
SWILRWSALDEGGSLGLLAQLLRDLRGIGVLFAVVALGIGPGIGEELFFRGFLQPMIGEHWRRAAIPLAAGAFALAHVDPVHAAAAFPLGLYLGALRYCTGSTLGAILAHAANNSLAVLGATLSGWVLLASILFLILAVAFGIRLIQAGRQPTFPDRELQP